MDSVCQNEHPVQLGDLCYQSENVQLFVHVDEGQV